MIRMAHDLGRWYADRKATDALYEAVSPEPCFGSSISGVPVRRAANQTCGAGEHTTAESAYITRKNGSTTLDIGL